MKLTMLEQRQQTTGILRQLHTGPSLHYVKRYKMLSYRRETALQGTLVLAESGRLELRDNILLIL